jgi:hypothetical protein
MENILNIEKEIQKPKLNEKKLSLGEVSIFLQNDQTIVEPLLLQDKGILQYASKRLQKIYIDSDIVYLQYASEEVQKTYITKDNKLLQYASEELQKTYIDSDISLYLQYASEELQKTYITNDNKLLLYASKKLQRKYNDTNNKMFKDASKDVQNKDNYIFLNSPISSNNYTIDSRDTFKKKIRDNNIYY